MLWRGGQVDYGILRSNCMWLLLVVGSFFWGIVSRGLLGCRYIRCWGIVADGADAVEGGAFFLLFNEYISMIVEFRNRFDGCLSLVSVSVCRSVAGGCLEVLAPCERTGFHYVGSVNESVEG